MNNLPCHSPLDDFEDYCDHPKICEAGFQSPAATRSLCSFHATDAQQIGKDIRTLYCKIFEVSDSKADSPHLPRCSRFYSGVIKFVLPHLMTALFLTQYNPRHSIQSLSNVKEEKVKYPHSALRSVKHIPYPKLGPHYGGYE